MINAEDLEWRFRHHAPPDQHRIADHAEVRARCLELAIDLNRIVPDGREKSLAMTNLEEVMMWANAGIARQG